MNTSPIDTLAYDTARIASWRSDLTYSYSRELVTPDMSLSEWIGQQFGKLLRKLFGAQFDSDAYSDAILIGIAILLLALAVWFVYRKRPAFFMRSPKSAVPYKVEEDTIYGVDFPGEIAAALAKNDYREAARLLYLQTLKRLSDEGRIDWQPYKTPTQYDYEMCLPAFRELTVRFLRVRYGNFEADEALFRTMQALQDDVAQACRVPEEKGGEE